MVVVAPRPGPSHRSNVLSAWSAPARRGAPSKPAVTCRRLFRISRSAGALRARHSERRKSQRPPAAVNGLFGRASAPAPANAGAEDDTKKRLCFEGGGGGGRRYQCRPTGRGTRRWTVRTIHTVGSRRRSRRELCSVGSMEMEVVTDGATSRTREKSTARSSTAVDGGACVRFLPPPAS